MVSLPPKGDSAKRLGSYFSPLKVEAQATPDMTVKVNEGAFWDADGNYVEYIGGNSPQISAPTSGAKWVLVTLTPNGMINIVDGVESAQPDLPSPSTYKGELPLAAIFVGDTTTAITNDMIFDFRPLWHVQPDSVSQAQLNNFATKTYVDNAVTLKADVDGTTNSNFTLNKDGSSINDGGLYMRRFSGTIVGIRFNETAVTGSPPTPNPQWEFTNDGVTWNPIGVASGSYYTKTDLNNGALDFLYVPRTDLNPSSAGAGFLDSRYYEKAVADVTFAQASHTHFVSDIIGLSNPVNTINSIAPDASGNLVLSLGDLNDVTIAGTADSQVPVYDSTISGFRNRLLFLSDLSDVDNVSPSSGDVLIHNGSMYINRKLLKSDITNFVEGDYVLTGGTNQDVFGVKTFKDGIVIENSLTITGTNTSIDTTTLVIRDNFIDINYGETGPGVTAGTAGIRVDRGSAGSPASGLPAAIIQWDETAKVWEFGVEGNVHPILTDVHTHISNQIADFVPSVTSVVNTLSLNELQDVNYTSSPSTGDYLIFGVSSWENRNFSNDVLTEINNTSINELSDVSVSTPNMNEVLKWNGSQWSNILLVKSDVSDFVETDYIHTFGNETKSGDLTINGNFTIGGGIGSISTINSETLYIKDSNFTINYGETLAGVGGGGGTAGFIVDRGTEPNVQLWWSEPAGKWLANYISGGSVVNGEISFVGHTHILADVTDVIANATEVNALVGIVANSEIPNTTVSAQILDRITRRGDTMDAGANLTFVSGGEVLGLPVTPSANDAATSKAYVDAGDSAINTSLTNHMNDMNVHMTPQQNTFFDNLALTGSPALTANDVNQLIGISGNVQAQLNTKTDKVVPTTHLAFAALDGTTGNLLDSGIILNDTATTLTNVWSAQKIDNTKADKVSGAIAGNYATLDASGNLQDSGTSLNDGAVSTSVLWSANKISNELATKSNIGHTHVTTDITDWASTFTTELGNNSIQSIGDVTNNALINGDLLQWNGAIWDNVQPTSITQFVKAQGNISETINGQKTFADNAFFQQNVTITQSLNVGGSVNINGNLTVSGDRIVKGKEVISTNTTTLNYGSTDPLTAHGGGVILQRQTAGSPVTSIIDEAVILWDEFNKKWKAGLYNSSSGINALNNIAIVNETPAQPYYEYVSGTGNATYPLPFAVPQPATGKAAIQVFVNGIKQIEGVSKTYTVDYSNPSQTVVVFNAGSEPAVGDDVEFYGFGLIG